MRLQRVSIFWKCKLKPFYHTPTPRFISQDNTQPKISAASDLNHLEVCPTWPADEEPELRANVLRDMRIIPNFITEQEETTLLAELEPVLKRMRYEFDHWDNFCGGVIAGLCLLSSAVMRLEHPEKKHLAVDALLERRCLYIMRGVARYNMSHSVCGTSDSVWRGATVPRRRRVAVILRQRPLTQHTQ
ncbi:unnamed protein product [Diatraea saccharalis]|uniref:Uncharacterized protein n=1 Tax=Diatraea saccharalis TaxID=40085 RepID=A0A9N9WGR9_9NEOP|nr:unnamed protein product [Diatraea saccharalis]